jgi:hypothetical protein
LQKTCNFCDQEASYRDCLIQKGFMIMKAAQMGAQFCPSAIAG